MLLTSTQLKNGSSLGNYWKEGADIHRRILSEGAIKFDYERRLSDLDTHQERSISMDSFNKLTPIIDLSLNRQETSKFVTLTNFPHRRGKDAKKFDDVKLAYIDSLRAANLCHRCMNPLVTKRAQIVQVLPNQQESDLLVACQKAFKSDDLAMQSNAFEAMASVESNLAIRAKAIWRELQPLSQESDKSDVVKPKTVKRSFDLKVRNYHGKFRTTTLGTLADEGDSLENYIDYQILDGNSVPLENRRVRLTIKESDAKYLLTEQTQTFRHIKVSTIEYADVKTHYEAFQTDNGNLQFGLNDGTKLPNGKFAPIQVFFEVSGAKYYSFDGKPLGRIPNSHYRIMERKCTCTF